MAPLSDVARSLGQRSSQTLTPRSARHGAPAGDCRWQQQLQPFGRSITPPPQVLRHGASERLDDRIIADVGQRQRPLTPPPLREAAARVAQQPVDGCAPSSERSMSASTPRQQAARLHGHALQAKSHTPSAIMKDSPYAGLESKKFEEVYHHGRYIRRGRAYVDHLEGRDGCEAKSPRCAATDRRNIGAGVAAAETAMRQRNRGRKGCATHPLTAISTRDIMAGGDLFARAEAVSVWQTDLDDAAGLVSRYGNEVDSLGPRRDKSNPLLHSASAPYLSARVEEQPKGRRLCPGHRSVIHHVDELVFQNPLRKPTQEQLDAASASLLGAAGSRHGAAEDVEHKVRGKRILDGCFAYTSASGGNYDWGNVPDNEMRMQAATKIDGNLLGIGSSTKLKGSCHVAKLTEGVLPTIFVSHGPGAMILSWDRALPVMRNISRLFENSGVVKDQVRAILVISSHWPKPAHEGVDVMIGVQKEPQRLLCDFSGALPDDYKTQSYAPYGDPALSARVDRLLAKAGFRTEFDSQRYLDSGVWIPMLQMKDFLDVPVVEISLPGTRAVQVDPDGCGIAETCLRIGAALRPLRSEGVLIMGSGQVIKGSIDPEHMDQWCHSIKRVCCCAQSKKRWTMLQRWQSLPHARQAHPQEENLLPLHVVAGAAHEEPGQCLGDFRLGKTAMMHFRFGDNPLG